MQEFSQKAGIPVLLLTCNALFPEPEVTQEQEAPVSQCQGQKFCRDRVGDRTSFVVLKFHIPSFLIASSLFRFHHSTLPVLPGLSFIFFMFFFFRP